VTRAAQELYGKVGQVKADFKLSMSVSGAADLSGKTTVSMNITAHDAYRTPSEVTPMLAPGPGPGPTSPSSGGHGGLGMPPAPPTYMQ
jgi:hypothetical protein